jgi:hypothetical protein
MRPVSGARTRIGVGDGVGLGDGVAVWLGTALAVELEPGSGLADGLDCTSPTGAGRPEAGEPSDRAPVATPPTPTAPTRASVAAADLTDRLIVRTPGLVLVASVA